MLLTAEVNARGELKLPFSKIRIIDSRPDTSKIGYVDVRGGLTSKKRSFERVLLQNGNGNAIEKYYADYFSSAFAKNDFELLIVMKRFWLSANIISNERRIEAANSVGSTERLYCKWEYYLGQHGKYLPIKRIDTVFLIIEDLERYDYYKTEKERQLIFKGVLNGMVEVLDYSNAMKQFDDQPKKTLDEIHAFNDRINMIPVLQDSVVHRGVYLSFDDFKNNRPSIIDFQEKKMHYGRINQNTEIYLEDMKGETISNYWGYSDGKEFRYGMLGNDKIYRIQNTFCFFIKVVGYVISSDSPAGSTMVTTSKNKYEVWAPFQIDMETGQIY